MREIVDWTLGWDVTDFNLGDYHRTGLLLFTIRNGNVKDPESKQYAEKIMMQGERILISQARLPGQDFEQVVVLPACQERLAFDAPFARFLVLEQVQGEMAQHGQVLGAVVFADAAAIFVQGDAERPSLVVDAQNQESASQRFHHGGPDGCDF